VRTGNGNGNGSGQGFAEDEVEVEDEEQGKMAQRPIDGVLEKHGKSSDTD
jgi:hypothetical protein